MSASESLRASRASLRGPRHLWWNPGVPDDWFYVDDDDPERKEVLELTRFLSFDTHRSGRLFEALSYVPTYPTSIIPR